MTEHDASGPVIVGLGEVLWDELPGGRRLGGAPANFAYHARALGARGAVVSCVGADEDGREILRRLDELGLDRRHVAVDPDHPTGTVDVRLDAGGIPVYAIREDAAWDHLPPDSDRLELATRADAVCYGSLGSRSGPSRRAIRDFVDTTRGDCLRIFDVNLRHDWFDGDLVRELLERADLVKLNDEELPVVGRLVELTGGEDALLEQLCARYSLRAVALTRGGEGSRLLAPPENSRHPGHAVDVVDTVGAGDAFTAAIAVGFLRGWPLDEINERAGRLASFVCGRTGATPAIPPDLSARLVQDPS